MRLALASLAALTATFAAAQTPPPPAPPAAPPPASTTPAAPAPAAPAAPGPQAGAPAAAPAAEAPPPAPPPPPPAPPTDPAAIAILSVLQNVCIPAANGGDLPKLAKAAGYRKTDNDEWLLRQHDFTLRIENPGSNPNQCHVDVTHPADLEAPGRPIIVALHEWATGPNGWSLYQNSKSVEGDAEYTVRSWQHEGDGKSESLVFTTHRHADGTPLQRDVDQSILIYAVTKS